MNRIADDVIIRASTDRHNADLIIVNDGKVEIYKVAPALIKRLVRKAEVLDDTLKRSK